MLDEKTVRARLVKGRAFRETDPLVIAAVREFLATGDTKVLEGTRYQDRKLEDYRY